MTMVLLKEAFSHFPYGWRIRDEHLWQSTIDGLRQLLLSLNEGELRSLYATAAGMIKSRSLQGPTYIELWFFSHPSYEILKEFLQNEVLCQGFAAYLDMISICRKSKDRVDTRKLKAVLTERAEEVQLLVRGYDKLIREHRDGYFGYFEPSFASALLIPNPEISEQSIAAEFRKAQRSILAEEIDRSKRAHPQPAWTKEFKRIFDFVDDELLENPVTVATLEGLLDDLIPMIAIDDFTLDLPKTWCPIDWFGNYLLEMMSEGAWVKYRIHDEIEIAIGKAGTVDSNVDRDLIAEITNRSRSIAHAHAVQLRSVRQGRLPVGIKIHCVSTKPRGVQFLTQGNFQAHNANTSFNLPPVGNTKAVADMFEKIKERSGVSFLNNLDYQIQVCSPGELSSKNAALLGVGFYLASDPIRRYSQQDFDNTSVYPGRLVIYGAGVCDLTFDWWERDEHNKLRIEALDKKLKNRTDVLSCQSMRDVENVNLMATLLMHTQYNGYWAKLGEQFIAEVEGLLEQHQLSGILNATWIVSWTTPPTTSINQEFWAAFEELMNYAFDEAARINRAAASGNQEAASQGILFEVQQILEWYRSEIELQTP